MLCLQGLELSAPSGIRKGDMVKIELITNCQWFSQCNRMHCSARQGSMPLSRYLGLCVSSVLFFLTSSLHNKAVIVMKCFPQFYESFQQIIKFERKLMGPPIYSQLVRRMETQTYDGHSKRGLSPGILWQSNGWDSVFTAQAVGLILGYRTKILQMV